MRRFVLIVVLFLLVAVAQGRSPRKDPQTGRVRVLYIGDAWGPTPFFYIKADPAFVATPIPATYAHTGTYTGRQLEQFMRIYMPRTYKQMVLQQDVIVLSDANRGLFKNEHLEWFRRGVEEDGMGIMMVGGIEAFGGDSGYPSWSGSPVEEALPVLCVDGKTFRKDFKAQVKAPDDPFIKSLPWKTMPFFHGMNVVNEKEGSKLLLSSDVSPHHPVLVYWNYGKGSGLAHAPDWTPAWGASIMYDWDYYADYIVNMNYLISGVDIPQNPELMHRIRTRFTDYATKRALAVSLMEFVESFGAKIAPAEEDLEEIAKTEKAAEEYYIEQDYDQTLSTLDQIDKDFDVLSKKLVELKDRALFWIYVVEWLAVSGTAVLCGVLLWTLMVRRRLYREVEITRSML